MDGTGTDLGPQVGTAIFGYFIGVACAVSGFLLGRQACEWISDHYCRLPHLGEGGQTVVESLDHADGHAKADSWLKLVSRSLVGTITDVNYWPFVLVVGLLAAFIYGGTGNGSQAYRHMWISMLLTPGGALLRWRISELNVRKQWMVRRGWGWFPLGTLIANLVAAIICAFVEALTARYLADGETNAGWILPCLHAVVIGFSGSLSTVSTLVREMFALDSVGQAHCYCFITIVSSMLISLLIYSPMVRTD